MFDYHGLTIGFHGCEEEVARKALLNQGELIPSENKYDWLGSGIYFWENDPIRALEFATITKKCSNPCVIGAVMNLGYCLDLSTRSGLASIRLVWENIVKSSFEKGDLKLNKAGRKGENGELMLRFLDCYVIEALHKYNVDNGYEEFDSVRAPFWEGEEIYPTAGFFNKNHIQLCIRNPKCILGYFLPRDLDVSL
ncbi:MAG: hypothetical protein HDS97_04050 [Bacteroidales bacterium]|nr:hypothetical protein [Bacteroidales bacterium]